ncbi:MAG TPA: vWA domain-containing protein [Thermoanaerobaculaceae bacterium]|nr:vWA domain-containing protein [Thermoanaerobaculaceae bacterium]
MTWTDPRWLWLAGTAVLALLATPWVARWRSLQQARLAGTRLWVRWLGGVPATGAARLALWLLAAAAAAVVAAGPRWGHGMAAVSELNVAIALDVSASMRCADVPPDRLGRAVAVLRQAMTRVGTANWAVAAGAGTARAWVPLTSDARSAAAAVAEPDIDRGVEPGSNLAVLLSTAASLLETGGPGRAVVLISDGEQLEGDAARVAEALRRSGVAVVALVSGTAAGGPVPSGTGRGAIGYLRQGDGSLVTTRAHPELLAGLCASPADLVDASSPGASRRLADVLRGAVAATTRATAPVRSLPFSLASAALATASFLLWPWRLRAFAVAVLVPELLAAQPLPRPTPSALERALPGSATCLARRATAAMERGEWPEANRAYAAASALRPDDESLRLGWATAAALAGEPGGEDALLQLTELPEVAWEAWYNLGTVRLARGDAAGAVEPLLHAVKSDPDREEAWHNLELALAGSRRAGDRNAGSEAAAGARARLVEAAARAALAPLPVAPAAHAAPQTGRSW